jgi:spore coat-associated protein N
MAAHRITKRGTTSRRVLYTVGAIGLLAALAAGGTYASFTASVSESQQFTAGTVSLVYVGAAGSATNRLTISASGIIPGDTISRAVDLQNNGTENLSAVTLTTTASPSSLLDTDAVNGLQMVIDRCSAPWTETGSSPAFSYTCGATQTSVLASRAIVGSGLALANLTTTTTGNTDHLRVLVTFAATATNTMQGLTSTITYAFDGTQRANSAH